MSPKLKQLFDKYGYMFLRNQKAYENYDDYFYLTEKELANIAEEIIQAAKDELSE